MLIPLRHENMRGRRWPVITFGLIALNFLVFLGTHWTIEEQEPVRAEVPAHVLLLSAMHPELKMPDDAQKFVEGIHSKYPEAWKQLASPDRKMADAWDARVRAMDDPQALQAEMDTLAQSFEDLEQSSIIERFAFTPANPRFISYITANFLHGGWLHIIGNMWFLWLAGFILEDNWGRVLYSVFYLLAGAAALQFHAWAYPESFAPVLGASGAVAALMGAFLVRFPKMKIEMLWYMIIFRIRFKAYAYWLLPLWLLLEISSGTLFGQFSGVAHWAHVGGFVFGMLAAVGLRYSGLEHKANAAIEEKVGWSADPAILKASEAMEQGKHDEAISALQRHVAAKPDSKDALVLLQQAQWRKGDVPGLQAAAIKLCQLHLKAHDPEAAWASYEEYTNSGGERMPAATWLELCRFVEGQQNYDRATTEYEKLGLAYPTERQGLLAFIAAGRLSLKNLKRPSDALRFYQAAAASSVPHLDWEANIQSGIQESQKLLAGSATPVA